MKGSVELWFSPEARRDLDDAGRIARSLLSSAIRDQLLGSPSSVTRLSTDAAAEIVPQTTTWDAPTAVQPDRNGWWVIPIGKYRAIVQPVRSDDDGQPGALVARVIDARRMPDLAQDDDGGYVETPTWSRG